LPSLRSSSAFRYEVREMPDFRSQALAGIAMLGFGSAAGAQQPPSPPRIVEVEPAPQRIQLTGIIREESPGNPVLESGESTYAVVPHQHALAMRFLDVRVHVIATEVASKFARSQLLIHEIERPVDSAREQIRRNRR
jgi:hypothetical protein